MITKLQNFEAIELDCIDSKVDLYQGYIRNLTLKDYEVCRCHMTKVDSFIR